MKTKACRGDQGKKDFSLSNPEAKAPPDGMWD